MQHLVGDVRGVIDASLILIQTSLQYFRNSNIRICTSNWLLSLIKKTRGIVPVHPSYGEYSQQGEISKNIDATNNKMNIFHSRTYAPLNTTACKYHNWVLD